MNKDYRDGIIEGMTRFAWWKDGVQYVGAGAMTLKDAIKELPTGSPWLYPGTGSEHADPLTQAINIAVTAHDGQFDKNHQPYILHPLRVMLAMNTIGEKVVAVLHDVVEDTPVTLDMLRETFDSEIIEDVDCLTKRKGESYDAYLCRVAFKPRSRSVKLADVRDNASPMRLYMLDPETVIRLTKKYLRAIQVLSV